jgi:hypothetical protein
MRSGGNLWFNVIRNNNAPDDEVGGAQITGSLVFENVSGFLQQHPIDQVFLVQGLETDRMFTLSILRPDLDIRERDYIVVKKPLDHRYYNKNLRVLSVMDNSMTDQHRRGMFLSLSHSVRAHSIQ